MQDFLQISHLHLEQTGLNLKRLGSMEHSQTFSKSFYVLKEYLHLLHLSRMDKPEQWIQLKDKEKNSMEENHAQLHNRAQTRNILEK